MGVQMPPKPVAEPEPAHAAGARKGGRR